MLHPDLSRSHQFKNTCLLIILTCMGEITLSFKFASTTITSTNRLGKQLYKFTYVSYLAIRLKIWGKGLVVISLV